MFSALAWEKLPLPIAPWLQVSWGPLRFSSCLPVGEEGGQGKGEGVLPGRRVRLFMVILSKRLILSFFKI